MIMYNNVDRLITIWQVLNLTQWFEKDDPSLLSSLKLFHKDITFNYFTSCDVKK